MRAAKGGILFIDEAYALAPTERGTFGTQAITTLMNQITSPEFKGNLLIILAGYEDKMEELFKLSNPGFRSRFDKKRIEFKEWDEDMATRATIRNIEKKGLTITLEAQEVLPILYRTLRMQPGWGSARDVFR